MGILATAKNHNKLYYNSTNSIGKKSFAYIKSSQKTLLTINTEKDNLTSTQWAEIANNLKIKISELIDKNHIDFKKEYGKDEIVMEDSEWLKILDKKPHLVSHPILLVGEKIYRIEKPTNIIKHIEPDSAGLEKPY